MKTKPCPRCGKTNPAEIHTCTPKQDQSIDLNCPVGTLDHNGRFELLRMVGVPINQPMKLYEHPAPRPEFVRLSEEEVDSLTYAPYEPYKLICAVENLLVEKNNAF